MAMLADKRERANYILQPRGKALYEDNNRFGTRMLEKMGWSAGKGLGANEDGQKEFVRLKYKNGTTGFGFQDRSDQWTQHEEQFDGLLKTLGGSEQNSIEDAVPAFGKLGKFSGESLEEKSKKSRARVHYKKFTKGKDLSQYSEKDLANIFGRKTLEKEAPLGFGVHGVNQSSNSSSEGGESKNFGITTISAGTSIKDYFKSKMENIKSNRHVQDANGGNVSPELEYERKVDERDDLTDSSETSKNEELDNAKSNEGQSEEHVAASHVLESRMKAKKRKQRDSETQENFDSQKLELAESKKVKKQKVKKNDRPDDRGDLFEEVQNATLELDTANQCNTEERIVSTDSGNSTIKRHKRKRCKSETQEPCDPQDIGLGELKKKKKDKKKPRYGGEINGGNADENIQSEPLTILDDLDLSRNTKRKKRKFKESELVVDSSTTTELYKVDNERAHCDQNSKSKKKKKNKTNKEETGKETTETHLENGIDRKISDENKETQSYEEKKEIPKDDLQLNSNVEENEYKINSFVALKFRNADLDGFPGSNIAAINGYRLPKKLKLVVVERPQDMLNVTKFCYDAIEKAKLRDKRVKETQNVNETSQPEETAEEIKIKKEKKRRAKYSYMELIRKAKTKNVFGIV
uniref:Putative transcriptional regulator atrx protein isoform x1 n=1 Tax=Tabanus bromius TaxID=304241 RepID=A0A0K8TRN8_TABBR